MEDLRRELVEDDVVIPAAMMLEVESVLGMADEWNFNPFRLSEVPFVILWQVETPQELPPWISIFLAFCNKEAMTV